MATKGSTDTMAASLVRRCSRPARVQDHAFATLGTRIPPVPCGVFLLQAAELALRARTVLACARNTPHRPCPRFRVSSAQHNLLSASPLSFGRRKRFRDAYVVFVERRGLSERSEFRSLVRNTTYASRAQA